MTVFATWQLYPKKFQRDNCASGRPARSAEAFDICIAE